MLYLVHSKCCFLMIASLPSAAILGLVYHLFLPLPVSPCRLRVHQTLL